MLSVVMLSVAMLNVKNKPFMLSVVMLNVNVLSVVAPLKVQTHEELTLSVKYDNMFLRSRVRIPPLLAPEETSEFFFIDVESGNWLSHRNQTTE